MPSYRVAVGKPVDPCQRCPLGLVGKGFVRGDGPFPAKILVVGEAPGETEAREGRPFVGPAGRMFDSLLRRAGLDRSPFRVANTICCQPPKNYLVGAPWEQDALASCYPLLEEEIAKTRPQVIVALGNTALKRLTGLTGISRLRGFPIRHSSGAWVMPTYHPSFLLPRRGQKESAKLMGLVRLDLRRALDMAERGFALDRSVYALDPTPDEAAVWATGFEAALRAGRAQYLSWDIETPGKLEASQEEDLDSEEDDPEESPQDEYGSTQILRVSFAYLPGVAMSIPWRPEYGAVIRRLLGNPEVRHVTWNGFAFDVPIVALNNVAIRGTVYDGMWAWHLLQSDLPRGLEAVASVYAPELGPWKHLGASDPAYYNAKDADAALRNFLGIEGELRDRGTWGLYERHVVELYPILFRAGRQHGVLVDQAYQRALRIELEAERDTLFRQAQRAVAPELRRQKLYVRPPKGRTEEVVPVRVQASVKVCAGCGKVRPVKTHFTKGPCSLGAKVELRDLEVERWHWQPPWETLHGEALLDAVSQAGFNPVSSKQMLDYAKAHGHAVGKDYKTGKPQFDKQTRKRLIKAHGEKHPIYGISQKLQDLTKTLGTYVVGFAPDRQGKIYTTYSFSPSTARLASRNKNLQNVSNHAQNNPYAPRIRRQLVAKPGHVFVEADSAAIEAVLTGHFQGDLAYIELARQGVHDFVTCKELGREFDPALLGAYKKDPLYKVARERNKRVVHGTNYGMTPKMMVKVYPEAFRTEWEAKHAQDRYFECCPRLAPWQHEIRLTAHRQGYIQNPWGYRHYFNQVFVKNDKGEIVHGPDAKRVVAFLPQSSAAAFMRDSLLLLGQSKWLAYAPAMVSIHDSICLEVPEGAVEDAKQWLVGVLTRPVSELGGLRIGCEVKVGPNWAEMQVVHVEKIGVAA